MSSRAPAPARGRPGRGPGGPDARPGAARRKHPPRRPRYWLRRVLTLAVFVVLVAGVSYGVVAGSAWVRDEIRAQDAEEAAASTPTVYPDPVACTDQDVTVTAVMPSAVRMGAGLGVELTVTNSGDDACLLDVGSANLGAVITSGPATIWVSAACQADPTSRVLLIPVGDTVSTTLWWDGRNSGDDCTAAAAPEPESTASPTGDAATAEATDASPDADDPAADPSATPTAAPTPSAPRDPSVARPGTYVLRIQLGGADVTGEQVFVVT